MTKKSKNNTCELSVIAPCFNEGNNIEELVSRTLKTFDKKGIDGEIILIDDCSRDNTWEMISKVMKAEKRARGVHHEINQGMVGGWRSGMAKARGQYICIIDSDLQNLPEDIYRLYREIKRSDADIVQAVRRHIGKLKDSRYILSKGLNTLLNILFSMNAQDNKSGFLICRKEVFQDILDYRYSYKKFQTYIGVAAKAKGYTVREVETLFVSRETGKSYIPTIPVRFILENLLETVTAWIEYRVLGVKDNSLSNYLEERSATDVKRTDGLGQRSYFFRLARVLFPFHYWMLSLYCFDYLNELEESQSLSKNKLEKLQWIKLRRILIQAYQHVPYYTDLFDQAGLTPDSIRGPEDFSHIPVLTKELIRENQFYDLMSDNHNKKKVLRVYTSGPDGAPLTFYLDNHQLDWRWATNTRSSSWTGYTPGYREFRITHGNIGASAIYKLKEKLSNLIRRRRHISAFELNKTDLSGILGKINSFRPYLVSSYAETLKIMASTALKKNMVFDRVQAVISSSQSLSPKDRDLIEDRFNAKVFNHYKLRELGTVAAECDCHQGMHINAENYLVEILDKKGKPAKPGQMGDIVITDLNNRCMPLIRYKTGDRARFVSDTRCGCGRELPRIDSIEGRPQSMLFGHGDRFLTGSFFTHMIKDYEFAIRKFKVVQTKPGKLDLYIIPGLRYNPKIEQKLTDTITHFLGPATEITITLEDKLEGDVVENLIGQE